MNVKSYVFLEGWPEIQSYSQFPPNLRISFGETSFLGLNKGMPESSLPDHLVLYDGVCALCNGTVRFLIGLDEDRILHFAPLQGSTAENLLREHGVDLQMKSMVFADRDPGGGPHRLYFRSDAILHIFRRIGGLWSVLAWTRFLPRFIRDTVYDVIAGNRYRWFGKSEACFLPPPEARERFLD